MPRRTLLNTFRTWAFSRRQIASPRRMNSTLMLLETVEERLAPATLPTPTPLTPTATAASNALALQQPTANNGNVTIDYLNPQVVADPTNPQRQVLVATRYVNDPNATPTTTLAAVVSFSTNGGTTFSGPSVLVRPTDPLTAADTTPIGASNSKPYNSGSAPAVAFGRDGTIYYVYLAQAGFNDKTRGAVLFSKAAFGGVPGTPTILYQWYSGDQASNPTVAVDNNLLSFTDPESLTTYTDPLANRTTGRQAVYVAWNANSSAAPNDITTSNGVTNYNTNPILAAVSGDNGTSWSNPTPVNNGGYLTGSAAGRGIAPQIVFSPGNSGAPGSLVFAWPQQNFSNNQPINTSSITYDATRPVGTSLTAFVPQAYTATQTFTSATGNVPDAGEAVSPATFDSASSKTFSTTLTTQVPLTDTTFTLQDLSVNLAFVTPFLDQIRIELLGPNNSSLVLLNNRTLGDGSVPTTLPGGQPFPNGISTGLPGFTPNVPPPPAAGLGIINGAANTYTVFSDNAPRRINDPASVFPYIGAFRPENGGFFTSTSVPTAAIQTFLQAAGLLGATPATLVGKTLSVRITDFRADRLSFNGGPYTAPEFLKTFGLKLSSVPNGFGSDNVIGTVSLPIGTDFNNAPTGGYATGFPSLTAASSAFGLPSNVSLAFDTSLGDPGIATPFGGSLYLAYTAVSLNTAVPAQITDTNIRVIRATIGTGGTLTSQSSVRVNDDSPADNFTEGNRAQFLPAVTVDATTGTAVVTWFDTRLDANGTRAASFIATSITGGASWSNQTVTPTGSAATATNPATAADGGTRSFLDQPKNALDVITNTTYTLQPVPTNILLGNPTFGPGIRRSVIAAAGNIYAFWSGNPNSTGMGIESAHAVTAVGPRVVSGDMGPVTGPTTVGSVTYNSTVAADGTAQLDGFVVTFDRQVETGTAASAYFQYSALNPANYEVRYHNPYDALGIDTTINPTGVISLGGNQFLVQFPPQAGIGTYSYTVKPNIRDRVRTVVGSVTMSGNPMDEDADAVGGETIQDAFANPNPTTRTNGLYAAPYDVQTQPLVIPGPHFIGSSAVNGGSTADTSLVLAGVAAAVNVVFDRDINADPANGPTFTKANIVRFVGPIGVIYDRSTANGTNPLTVTRIDARTYRIGFPGQVLTGSYSIEVDSQIAGATGLGAGQPALIDTNLNAGLDVLRGTATAATGTPVDHNYTGNTGTIQPAVSGVPTTTEFSLNVPDSFLIQQIVGHQIQVVLNVSSATANNQRVVDLIGELVAPDGTTIRLFTNAGNTTRPPGQIWFQNTALRDDANTPIQSGFQPFSAGPYNPQFALADLNSLSSAGTWKLRIINQGSQSPNLTGWSLSLPQVRPGTGLGEANADRFTVSFRVFNQDPTDALTQKVWTPVGPAPSFDTDLLQQIPNAGSVDTMTADPSDPSGNTVYLGATSGGLWKTTDFLTKDAAGPTWVPLIDSGPTFSLNIASIAVFPRNNDPQQSVIFAQTGAGDGIYKDYPDKTSNNQALSTTPGTPGVGILRSIDGGKTWVVLDSLNNADTAGFGGNITSINASSRDRTFFNKSGFKIIVDPTSVNDPEKNLILYAAFATTQAGGTGGVYRSLDTGRHWTLLRAGDATDLVLAAGSAAVNTGNLQILYAGFRGDGVYIANPAYAAGGMTPIAGLSPGNGNFIDGDLLTQPRINYPNQPSPSGVNGRIQLAAPALTNNAVQNLNYQGWLYALETTTGGAFQGLYLTKDFGNNWTNVELPEVIFSNGKAFGTNNYNRAPHDTFAQPGSTAGQAKSSAAIAIDPLNPNVVYIGGSNLAAIGPGGAGTGGFIRVDTTGVLDAQAYVAYDNAGANSNVVQFTQNSGNVVTKPGGTKSDAGSVTSPLGQVDLGPGTPYGYSLGPNAINIGYLNVLRDPNSPFAAPSPQYFRNVSQIQNLGTGARYSAIFPEVNTNVHGIFTMVDPITGLTRLLVSDDEGVSTAVDDGTGTLISQLGDQSQAVPLPSTLRIGNLQTAQFFSSTTQPGQLAAEVSAALYYGTSRYNGFPATGSDILQTGSGAPDAGKVEWFGLGGQHAGAWGLTDPTGSGTFYQYEWPGYDQNSDPNQFFTVDGVGRTLFLIQPTDNPTLGTGNWKSTDGPKFAVNPVDPNGLAISAQSSGLFFRSTNQGRTWFQVAVPWTDYAPAIAFGSPEITATNSNQFNNFIYAGHGPSIAVSFNGGTTWSDISGGLSGTVQQIVPDTVRGSKAAYAVTDTGVYFKANATDPATNWTNITNGLFSLTEPILTEANAAAATAGTEPASLRSLTSLAVDWRYAIPDAGGPSATFPVLYVGGYGGVYRSLDRGKTWEVYPKATSYTYTDPTTNANATLAVPTGGYLPAVQITQLTLAQGNIDPRTGQPLQETGGLNLLTAATYGRGTWSIRLGTPDTDPAIAAITKYQVVQQSGPQVIGVDVTAQPDGTNSGTLNVTFQAPVLATTFTPDQIVIHDANGQLLTITGITPVVNTTAPANFPTVPVTPSDYHNLFTVSYTAVNPVATGFADVVIGTAVSDTNRSGKYLGISDYAGFPMNQDGDFVNGETATDPNNTGNASGIPAAIDSYHGSLYLQSTASAGVAGNLFISQPTTTTAGNLTRVIVSDLNTATGQPNAAYTGTISLTATIGGKAAILTSQPVVEIRSLSEAGNTVTVVSVGPQAFTAGQTVVIAGVSTAGYNGEFVVNTITPTGFTYTNPTAGLPPDAAGFGTVTGPEVPAAALTNTPTPVPNNSLPTTYTFTAADAGSHVFSVFYLAESGPLTGKPQTLLTATDITGSATAPNPAQAFISVVGGAANHFVLTGLNGPIVAGDPHAATVTAVDAFGNTDPNYLGTVTFTTTDPNAGVVLPAAYTFTAADAGTHTFPGVVLGTATTPTTYQTVTVTDTKHAGGPLTGSQSETVIAGAAATFTVAGFPNTIVAGTPGSFTVTAFDAFGNVADGYAGTAVFGSDDPQGTFTPPAYTFTAADAGVHVFTNGATLKTAGTHAITATDAIDPTITGQQTGIVVTPAATSQLTVSGFPSPITAGVAGTFVVAAQDQYGNATPAYTGTVALSTNNPLGSFAPAAYTFTAGDGGKHTFTNGATLSKAGTNYSITATDTTTATIAGTQTGITVTPAAAATLTVGGFPTPRTAGVAGSFSVSAFDAFGNAATGYAGTVAFSTDDVQGTFNPATYTFTGADAGSHTFTNGANLKTAGTHFIQATDTVTATVTGKQTGIVITPAATAKATLTGFPTTTMAGVPGSFVVAVTDQFGNTTPAYTGTMTFSSDDPQASFAPAAYTFTLADAGSHTFTNGATLKTAGVHSITGSDAVDPSINASETGITVTPAGAATLAVTGYPTTTVAGTAGTFTVTAFDAFGNTATGYTGTVGVSSDDPLAAFAPATYTFTGADAGTHTFLNAVTLYTAGTHVIQVTDTAGGLTGTQGGITTTPAATSQIVLSGLPTAIEAGVASPLTVTARDLFGNTTPAFVGTITFTSSDPQVSFAPRTYTFTAADAGTHTFPAAVSFRNTGAQTVTATDAADGFSSTANTTVTPARARTFRITGVPQYSVTGTPQNFLATAIDVFGQPVTNYTGTVVVSSSDPTATSQSPVTFLATDKGTKSITVTLNAVGSDTVTLTDTADGSVTGTATFNVVPRGTVATRYRVDVSPIEATSAFSRTVTVTAVDQTDTPVTGYSGTVRITSSDTGATLPGNITLTNGVGTGTITLRAAGPQTVTATDTTPAGLTGTQNVTVDPPVTPGKGVAVGSASLDTVEIYDRNGAKTFQFQPFPGFTGGTRVTTADVTGDGVEDYIAGTGPGVSTQVVVYDGATKTPILTYSPFESTFTGGVFVTTGDVNNDGIADIAISPDQGGGPRVVILNGKSFDVIANFFGIDDPNFRGGARAAIGDVNGDGYGDVGTAAGFLGGPRVSVVDGRLLLQGTVSRLFNDFFIFDGADATSLRNGAYLAMGDVNGDGYADLIAGGGPTGGPRVRILDGQSMLRNGSANPTVISNFFVRNANNDRGGVRVAVKNLDGDKYADLVAGDGDGVGSAVTAYKGSSLSAGQFDVLYALDAFPGVKSGVYVG